MHVWQQRGTLFFSVLMGDSRGYDAWAQRIAAGDWVGQEVFYQAPLYPYFLAVIYRLFGHDLLIVRVLQAVLGAVSCVALADAARRVVSPRAGLIAGLMLALYPPAIFFDGLIQKSVLDVLLVCVALAFVARVLRPVADAGRASPSGAPRDRAPLIWLCLGVTMGALSLTRENALVLVAVLAVWALSTREARHPLALAAGLAMILLPVAARNYAVGGGLYLTTSQFGSNLYIGNNPDADGSYMSLREGRGSPEFERLDATELAEQATGRSLTPSEVSGYWTARTLDYVRSQPGDYLRLMARKAFLLVNHVEIIDTESQESHAEYSFPLWLLSKVSLFGLLLAFGVFGAVALWPDRSRVWPLYALTAAYAVSVIAFFVVARYRLPLVPFVIVFAAAGAVRGRGLWTRLTPLRRALLLGVPFVVANWPLYSAASQQAITENNLGTALQDLGRTSEAITRYQRALQFDARYSPALSNLGTALRAEGRLDEAVAVYRQALAAGRTGATVYINLGNALRAQGRTEEAIASYRRALATEPGDTHASQSLANALYDLGTSALERGAPAPAEAAFREAVQLQPASAAAHNNLGIALASQGRLAEAITQWQRALQIHPDFADARRNLELAKTP